MAIENYFGGAVRILVIAALAVNIYFADNVARRLSPANVAGNEPARPEWRLIKIVDSACKECNDLSALTDFIRKSPVTVASEQLIDLADATELVNKYQITKLPALIIQGSPSDDPDLAGFRRELGDDVNGDFVLRLVPPPYKEVVDGKTRGLFKTTFLSDSRCAKCYDVNTHVKAFENLSMRVDERVDLDAASPAGRALVKKYKVKMTPTILIEGDLSVYAGLQQVWDKVGTKEPDGTYVFRQGVPSMGIYYDLNTGKVFGEVK